VPAIRGTAWITGVTQVLVDPTDPFPEGYLLSDTLPGDDVQARSEKPRLRKEVRTGWSEVRGKKKERGKVSAKLHWDGGDEYGARLGRGVDIYKLRVTVTGKKKKEVIEKLVIL